MPRIAAEAARLAASAARFLLPAAILTASQISVSDLSQIEPLISPIFRDARVERIAWVPGGARLWLRMEKVRACSLLGVRAFAGDPADPAAPRERLDLRDERGGSPGASHGFGDVRSGPWRVGAPKTDAGPAFFLVFWHRCHVLYTERSLHLSYPLAVVFDAPRN